LKKILITAHSSAVTESLAEILRRKYKVFTCGSDRLFAAIEHIRPDALIVDITLLGIDGLIDLRHAACIPPVLFIIANILTEQLLLTAQEVGTNYIVRIPFSLDAMAQRLDNLLGE